VNNLYDEASLLNRLIDDLQDLAQVESGHLRLEKTEENLDEIILSTVENYIPICRKQDLDLSYDISAGLPTVNVDAKRIAQILRNLLSNAIDYTPPGGKIVIKAEIEDHFIRVVVKDTGSGIAPEHIPYIFERFYRADSSRTRSTGGSGLGLSIVKQLVQAHGGQVGVDSTPGSGSDFFFTVPVSPK
jgi:signal transduction histidine kinase